VEAFVTTHGTKTPIQSFETLTEALNFDFSGEIITKIESFERAIHQYERATSESITDSVKIGLLFSKIQCFDEC